MEARKLFNRIGWAYALFLLVATGTQFLAGILIAGVAGEEADINILMIFMQISMYLFSFPLLIVLIRRIPSWSVTEKKNLTVSQFLLWLVFCFGLTYIGGIVSDVFTAAVKAVTGQALVNPVAELIVNLNPWVVTILTVLFAPVLEEMIFRKFLIDRIIPYGQWTAIILSGLIFGLIHGNFYQFFYACALGMVFAYLYSSTGRIMYTIVLHMAINAMGGLLPSLILQEKEALGIWASGLMLLISVFVLGSIVSAVLLAIFYAGKLPVYPGWETRPAKGLWRTIFLAPGMIVLLIAGIGLFFL